MITIKIHNAYRLVVAVVDTNLLGKTFTENNREIEITEHFFKGEEKQIEEAIEILKDLDREDATFNIVGENSINCALKAKVIEKEGIITIDKIPIALGLM